MTMQLLRPKKKSAAKPRRNGVLRAGDIIINGSFHIPPWVTDHDSFRRWALSEDFPERGQFFYLNGEVWADISMETLIHNQIKACISATIYALVFGESLGRFLVDRMMLTNKGAGLSCEPDAMFVSNLALDDSLVTIEDGDTALEVSGSPNMALEVVSKTSFTKDMVTLRELYAKAGISEYWIVDSTIETPELVILKLVGQKYVAVRKHGGWVKSSVFGRSFRLTSRKDAKGSSHFNLETK